MSGVDELAFEQGLRDICASVAPDAAWQIKAAGDMQRLLASGIHRFDDLVKVISDGLAASEIICVACWFLARWAGAPHSSIAVDTLVKALAHADPTIRQEAAQAFGVIGDESGVAVPALIRMLHDQDVGVRRAVVAALGDLGDERAVGSIVGALQDGAESPLVRSTAAEALISFEDPTAVSSLIIALGDPSAEVRFFAAFALGEMHKLEALPALERLASSKQPDVASFGSVSAQAAASIRKLLGD